MTKQLLRAFAISVFTSMFPIHTAVAEQVNERIGNGNFDAGKISSDTNRCQECHGVDGMSNGEKIPNHAGQYARYLAKQLADFQSGERKHETMTIMAQDLTPAEINNISSYFASQKVMKGDGEIQNMTAKSLFLNGDKSRDIEACVSCHGENGKGRIADNVIYPVIGGQHQIYLRTQLVNWKLGDRKNSPNGVMNKIAQALNDDEIEALSHYVSGL